MPWKRPSNLMASEREAVHDYLSVTTDGLTFRERFAEGSETSRGD